MRKLFILSALCHLLLMLSFTASWQLSLRLNPKEPAPNLVIPSYVVNEEKPIAPKSFTPPATPQKALPTSPNGIEKPAPKVTREMLNPNSYQLMKSTASQKRGIHLIGEKTVDKSLLKLLGEAINDHLYYPKAALDFNVRGVALVGYTVAPDGRVTDIQLVKSSGANVLDQAALSAVNHISPVKGAGEFLKQPRFIVVGIIFG